MADTTHESFPQPSDPSIRVWRYMNLAKFVWTLQKNALFFARLDHLGDAYEGYYTKPHETFASSPAGKTQGLPFKTLLKTFVSMRTKYFVNSWHMNEKDSAAMWRLYTSMDESICIASTYADLRDSFPPEVFLGVVRYIDYEQESFSIQNSFNFVMHKRKSYSHEREVRGVVWLFDDAIREKFLQRENGLIVRLDLGKLIKSVYVCPSATPMFTEVVEGLLKSYGLVVPVLQSEVNAPPPY